VFLRLLPALVCAVAFTAAVVLLSAPADAGPRGHLRLPDLDQELPSGLMLTQAGTAEKPEYRLAFRSAVRNVGSGALIIDGHRDGVELQTMVADQLVDRAGGGRRQIVPGVGRLRYVVSPDHRHWHLLRFQRYELRREGRSVPVVKDRKTGFCLGDRYAVVDRPLVNRAVTPEYRTRCGLEETRLLGIREGISVGYGDDYVANLEGQYLPITGLPDGRYVLVHRVNDNRRIHETSYGNNAASVLLSLRWLQGIPHLTILKNCPDGARCEERAR
jgi:hypothetical protein